jgi:hypothetical protein
MFPIGRAPRRAARLVNTPELRDQRQTTVVYIS